MTESSRAVRADISSANAAPPGEAPGGAPRWGLSRLAEGSARRAHYVLVAPAIVLLLIFSVLPSILIFALVFFDYDLLGGEIGFSGMENTSRILDSGELQQATRNTLLYAGLTVPVTLIVGFLVALGIHSIRRGATFWRSVYFLPAASTMAAMAVVWQWIFYPDRGVMDSTVGEVLGIQAWLGSTTWALPALAVVGNWQSIGIVVIIFLAGLAAVPEGLHEVAWLDGARAWDRLRAVTLPALGPATVFALIITTKNSLSMFDQVKVMTDGGPLGSTGTLAFQLFERSRSYLDIGGGAVITVVLMGLLLGVALVQYLLLGRRLEAGGTR